jgi:outer membrane protein
MKGESMAGLRVSAAGVLLAFSLPAAAQTLVDVYRLAHASDPKFRAAQAEFRASGQVLEQAKASYWPVAKGDFERMTTRQRVIQSNNPIFGAGVTDFPTRTDTLSITQPIFRKDLIERIGQARAIVRQSHYAMLAAEQDLMQRTAAAYLAVLAARDSLDLAKAEKDAVRKQLDLADMRLKRGLGTITNFHDAAARFAVDEAREIEAENKLADARQALKEITGRDIDAFFKVRDSIPLVTPQPADPEQWVQKAYEQNLALKARSEGVEVAQQEIERQRSGHWPSLSLVGSQNRRDAGSTLFGGGSTVDTQEITLRLTVPLFEGGMTTALTQEAVERHQKAKEDRELERRAVERQTRAAFKSVVSGTNLVRALSQSVQSQQSAMEGKELGVQRGLFTLIVVLDAQRDLFIARRDFAQARYDYLLNSLRLKQAAGMLTEEDLTSMNAALQQ